MELNTSLHSPISQTANLQNVSNGSVKTQNSLQQADLGKSTNNTRSTNNNANFDKVEQARQNSKLNTSRIIQDDQPSRSRVTRESENDIRELKPVVIDQQTPATTRAFLEVAASNSDFRLIDIYV